MRPSVCFSILVLAVVLVKASPAVKPAEKKSSVEDAKLESEKEDLKIEDTGSDKDRTKKSASFSVQIKPASFVQTVQAPCKGSQQVAPGSNIVVQSEQPIQSYNIVQPSYVQPSYVQTSYVQPSYVQSMPQASIALPQQMVAPYQSFQVIQSSSKPCAKPVSSVNIVPSVPQTEEPQASIEEPNSNSDVEEVPKEQLKPMKPERIEIAPEPLPLPQESLTILPTAPSCHEHLYTLPSSSMMYPELEPMRLADLFQGSSTPFPAHQCPCQNNIIYAYKKADMEPTAVKRLPYSSPVAGSPVMMPYNAKAHIVTHDHGMGPRPRHSHSHIHAHVDVNVAKPQSFVVPSSQYTVNLPSSQYTVNYPLTYSVSPILGSSLSNAENDNNSPLAFEVNDLMHSTKITREVDSSAKMEEIKQQADDNRKSIKEETKQN